MQGRDQRIYMHTYKPKQWTQTIGVGGNGGKLGHICNTLFNK